MSKIQNALIPAFLKRLDFWLMTHKPHIWRTRGHFVGFYGTIAAVLFFILGLVYPFTLFEMQEPRSHSSNVSFAFTVMSFFLVLGGLFLWWFSIQKYAYKRTNVKHFFIEIGIYTVSIFTLWTVFWAFSMGFDYKKSYLLEKNSLEDKEWFNKHSFPEFGYMPHVDANKLADLNKYFSNGEKLIAIQWNRAKITERYRQYTDNKYYSFIDADFSSNLSSLDWEFKTLINKTTTPPQYKKTSDYVNVLIGNDSVRNRISVIKSREIVNQNEDEYPEKVDDYEPLFDNIITGLDFAGIVELTENTYPRFYHHINFTSQSNHFLNKQVSDWTNQRAFLESLNPQELTAYSSYLKDLFDYYKEYQARIRSIKQLQFVAFKSFFNHIDREEKDSLDIDNYDNDYDYTPNKNNTYIGNEEKNAIAAEKLKKLLTSFDLDSKKKHVHWLMKLDDSYANNIKNPIANQILDKTYTTLKATALDSLILYDYYYLNKKNYDSYRAFFTNAYTDYIVKKYTMQDFDRLHNLLIVNGFPNETPQYKNSKLQKIALLFYSEKYRKAIHDLEYHRNSVKKSLAFTWSPFTVLYCLLAALVFYVMTLSTGIQFWISLFITGLYWAMILFLSELTRWGRYSDKGYSTTYSLPLYFMLIHVFIFSVLILYLLNRKYQAQRAHLIVNTILLSGIGSITAAISYWIDMIRNWYYAPNNSSMDDIDTIRIISNVLLGAILLYGLVAWLFKRHLTYPKKR